MTGRRFDLEAETVALIGGRALNVTLGWVVDRPDEVAMRVSSAGFIAERFFDRALLAEGVDQSRTRGGVSVWPGHGADEGWVVVMPAPQTPVWMFTEQALGSFLASAEAAAGMAADVAALIGGSV